MTNTARWPWLTSIAFASLILACAGEAPEEAEPAPVEVESVSYALTAADTAKCCANDCDKNMDCYLKQVDKAAQGVAKTCSQLIPAGKAGKLARTVLNALKKGKIPDPEDLKLLKSYPDCLAKVTAVTVLMAKSPEEWVGESCSDTTCDGKDQNCSGLGREYSDDADQHARYNQLCHLEPVKAFPTLYYCYQGEERCEDSRWQCRIPQLEGRLYDGTTGECICSDEAPVYNQALAQCMSCDKASPDTPWLNPETGNCEACPAEGQVWMTDRCACPDGPPLNDAGDKCACNDNEIWVSSRQACEPCPEDGPPPNADQTVCECPATAPIWVPETGTCESQCPISGQVWDGESCVCPADGPPLNDEGTACECPEYAPVWNSETGTCQECEIDGQIWNGDSCVCPDSGPPLNGDGTACECENDMEWDGAVCACPPDGPPLNEDGTACACPDGEEWNAETGKCEEENPCFVPDYPNYIAANYWWGDGSATRTATESGITMHCPNDQGSSPASLWANPFAGGSYRITAQVNVGYIDFSAGFLVITNDTGTGSQGQDERLNDTFWAGLARRVGVFHVQGLRDTPLSASSGTITIDVSGGMGTVTFNGELIGTAPIGPDDYVGLGCKEAGLTGSLTICPL